MSRNLLCLLHRATVLDEVRNPGRPEAALLPPAYDEPRLNPYGLRSPLDHFECVVLRQRPVGEKPVAVHGPKKGSALGAA